MNYEIEVPYRERLKSNIPDGSLRDYREFRPQLAALASVRDTSVATLIDSKENLTHWAAIYPIIFKRMAIVSTHLGYAEDKLPQKELTTADDRHEIYFPMHDNKKVVCETAGESYHIMVYERNPRDEKLERIALVVMPARNLLRTTLSTKNFYAEEGSGDNKHVYYPTEESSERTDSAGYARVICTIAKVMHDQLPEVRHLQEELEKQKEIDELEALYLSDPEDTEDL